MSEQILVVPVVHEETRYVDRNVTIHEHRAVTDTSISLLNEMQEKVLQNLIQSIPLKSNDFEGHLVLLRDEMNDGEKFIATAIVRGKRVEARDSFNKLEHLSIQERFQKIRDALAQAIANEVLAEPFFHALEHGRR